MSPEFIEDLLQSASPLSSQGADSLLDLRALLLAQGHAGSCVQCFFSLLNDMAQPGALEPLRLWLEQNLEIAVRHNGALLETMPVRLQRANDLEDFCQQAMDEVRFDRAFEAENLSLSLQYRAAVA